MVYYSNAEQKQIYEKYAEIGKTFTRLSQTFYENKSLNTIIWNHLTKTGLWQMPISTAYAGFGLTWHEAIVALDALFTHYPNIELFSCVLSQLSSLYLLANHAKTEVKKFYLLHLLAGTKTCFNISDNLLKRAPSHKAWLDRKINHLSTSMSNEILIYASNCADYAVFSSIFNQEKTITLPLFKNDAQDNSIIPKEYGWHAIDDVILFERYLYGVLSLSFVRNFGVEFCGKLAG